MYKFSVKAYHSDFKNQWDEFVAKSKNATFLFQRDFMDYHKDRFEDFSLMVYDGEQLLAILPANISNAIVYSHQGLTYGGLFWVENLSLSLIKNIFELVLSFLKAQNIQSVIVKSLAEFYHFQSLQTVDDLYRQRHSSIVKENIIMAIDYNSDYKISKSKIKRFNKLQTNGFTIKEGQSEFGAFWNTILLKRLADKHNTKPVHSLSEIQYLHSKFEDKIIQYNIYRNEEILGGITIFKKGNIVKSQYGMSSIEGEKLNVLDMLFVSLIFKFKDEDMQYFTMGSVNDNSELGYSKGMLKQKEELGCSQYTQNIWKIELND